ncbi:MAG: hypothetical protein US75_C0010G0050 [Candidatus Woesebacteria bacterium GW2011_GWC1_38_13]|uniref:Uncharacterized protein n=2 Tax=Candidatus Woeseibacteriota TaxID=1752722 RepID=A0A0G0NEM1_9BACT|nr:MAG: hypothetical protein US75_C0010G0050 [Candidatus Woesebacteria bacterium GW2011_GWC1_38_13]KKQ84344.1 MAG: hypothetical protein UT06_C0005G0003 [Candidatus Woesebacteria bacterium GW2011_GWA1_38_8]
MDSGSNSINERYIITPADKPRKKPRKLFLQNLGEKKIKLPPTVDNPASRVRIKGIKILLIPTNILYQHTTVNINLNNQ